MSKNVGGVQLTLAPQAPTVDDAFTKISVGKPNINGLMVSITVTIRDAEPILLLLSVALKVTVFEPKSEQLKLNALNVKFAIPQLSVEPLLA